MVRYILTVDPDRCDGCRLCEMICSLKKTGDLISPTKARVRVMKRETMGVDIPVVCRQCEDPPCRDLCPTNAITRHHETGAIVIDDKRCIGCRECMLACPFGAISFDTDRGVCVTCDLCEGDPACAKMCQWDVIKYERADLADLARRREAMEKIRTAASKAGEASGS